MCVIEKGIRIECQYSCLWQIKCTLTTLIWKTTWECRYNILIPFSTVCVSIPRSITAHGEQMVLYRWLTPSLMQYGAIKTRPGTLGELATWITVVYLFQLLSMCLYSLLYCKALFSCWSLSLRQFIKKKYTFGWTEENSKEKAYREKTILHFAAKFPNHGLSKLFTKNIYFVSFHSWLYSEFL